MLKLSFKTLWFSFNSLATIEISRPYLEEGPPLKSVCMKPDMTFHFAMKKFLFTLLFTTGEIKCNFVSGWSGWNNSLKFIKKRERGVETSMLEATTQAFIEEVKSTQQLIKILNFYTFGSEMDLTTNVADFKLFSH